MGEDILTQAEIAMRNAGKLGEPGQPKEGRKDHKGRKVEVFESEMEELKAKEKEAKEASEKFLRAMAELENFKKVMCREKEEFKKFANESIVRDILPVIDDLERAIASASAGGEKNAVLDGVVMIHKGLEKVLKSHGVEKIEAVGKKFDPRLHEAVEEVYSDEHPPGFVVEQTQNGYLINGRLISPAVVKVSRQKEDGKHGEKEIKQDHRN